ncbi:MAG: hypothetical protein A2015_15580 [Spirochaetes bacterium GWF1_31_7]|nr:MAG: hypothetical protein A2Y30_01595 [Spirochaetes bacterium GWE1_32_154]OHD47043.1 MAG: hypothetical protein A2Y29_06490 [Spirochaetes bacterium GWE2_31_10]OHD53049.1 MAG: hypothetical protein A2015_15580 [Spirochaetes bacterium GWF1_31_7]
MNTLILDGIFQNNDVTLTDNSKTTLDYIISKIDRTLFERVILLQTGTITTVPDTVKNVVIENKTIGVILKSILKESKNSDNIVIHTSGNPFFDIQYVKTMIDRHEKYVADYTYSIGFPDFLVPQIITPNCLKNLITLCGENQEIRDDYLFYAISKDINSFDIETFISKHDLRLYRISFGTYGKPEKIFLDNLLNSISPDTTYDDLVDYLLKNQHLFYTTVYGAFFEITTVSNTEPIYYPAKNSPDVFCDPVQFDRVLVTLQTMNPHIKIIFNGRGDPLRHPDFITMVTSVIEKKLELIIETDGYCVTDNITEALNDFKENITFVIKIDAFSDETYKKIHNGYDLNIPKAAFTLLKNKGFTTYRQIVRMTCNEDDIEALLKNKDMENLILRKYSQYCGTLPDRKVVDLSPLKRFPCYHIRREISFTPDLAIQLCMYSNEKLHCTVDDAPDVYKKEFISQTKAEYRECCKNCDDYYIFNF